MNFVTICGPWEKYPADECLRLNLYVGRLAALLRDAANDVRLKVYDPFAGTISALDAGGEIAIGPRRALVFSPQKGEIPWCE